MTEQSPDPTGVETTNPTPSSPAPADTSSIPAPPADPSTSTAPASADAPASSTSSTPAPSPVGDASSSTSSATSSPTSSGPGVGDLCTYAIEDEAGFETLTSCIVLEVFTEPDEDGKDVQLARVGVLPDERIVHADRLHTRS